MNQTSQPPAMQQRALFKAVKKILRPLVSLLLRQGVTYTALIDLLKTTYVDVAEQEFALEGKRQTDSRISVLTGVHRKEVKRIRELPESPVEPKENKASLSAQVMATWLGSADYTDAQGQPAPLPRTSESGELDFDGLVRSVTKDIHPRSMLDEWLHQGIAAINEEGLVQLEEAGYVPDEDFEEKLFFAGKNVGDHLAIVAHNLAGERQPMFDRAVYYQALSKDSVQELEAHAHQAAMNLLTEVNQKANRLQQRDGDLSEAEKSYQMHFGAYFLRDPEMEKGVSGRGES